MESGQNQWTDEQREYLRKHQLRSLIDDIMAECAQVMPSDPAAFIRRRLEERCSMDNVGSAEEEKVAKQAKPPAIASAESASPRKVQGSSLPILAIPRALQPFPRVLSSFITQHILTLQHTSSDDTSVSELSMALGMMLDFYARLHKLVPTTLSHALVFLGLPLLSANCSRDQLLQSLQACIRSANEKLETLRKECKMNWKVSVQKGVGEWLQYLTEGGGLSDHSGQQIRGCLSFIASLLELDSPLSHDSGIDDESAMLSFLRNALFSTLPNSQCMLAWLVEVLPRVMKAREIFLPSAADLSAFRSILEAAAHNVGDLEEATLLCNALTDLSPSFVEPARTTDPDDYFACSVHLSKFLDHSMAPSPNSKVPPVLPLLTHFLLTADPTSVHYPPLSVIDGFISVWRSLVCIGNCELCIRDDSKATSTFVGSPSFEALQFTASEVFALINQWNVVLQCKSAFSERVLMQLVAHEPCLILFLHSKLLLEHEAKSLTDWVSVALWRLTDPELFRRCLVVYALGSPLLRHALRDLNVSKNLVSFLVSTALSCCCCRVPSCKLLWLKFVSKLVFCARAGLRQAEAAECPSRCATKGPPEMKSLPQLLREFGSPGFVGDEAEYLRGIARTGTAGDICSESRSVALLCPKLVSHGAEVREAFRKVFHLNKRLLKRLSGVLLCVNGSSVSVKQCELLVDFALCMVDTSLFQRSGDRDRKFPLGRLVNLAVRCARESLCVQDAAFITFYLALEEICADSSVNVNLVLEVWAEAFPTLASLLLAVCETDSLSVLAVEAAGKRVTKCEWAKAQQIIASSPLCSELQESPLCGQPGKGDSLTLPTSALLFSALLTTIVGGVQFIPCAASSFVRAFGALQSRQGLAALVRALASWKERLSRLVIHASGADDILSRVFSTVAASVVLTSHYTNDVRQECNPSVLEQLSREFLARRKAACEWKPMFSSCSAESWECVPSWQRALIHYALIQQEMALPNACGIEHFHVAHFFLHTVACEKPSVWKAKSRELVHKMVLRGVYDRETYISFSQIFLDIIRSVDISAKDIMDAFSILLELTLQVLDAYPENDDVQRVQKLYYLVSERCISQSPHTISTEFMGHLNHQFPSCRRIVDSQNIFALLCQVFDALPLSIGNEPSVQIQSFAAACVSAGILPRQFFAIFSAFLSFARTKLRVELLPCAECSFSLVSLHLMHQMASAITHLNNQILMQTVVPSAAKMALICPSASQQECFLTLLRENYPHVDPTVASLISPSIFMCIAGQCSPSSLYVGLSLSGYLPFPSGSILRAQLRSASIGNSDPLIQSALLCWVLQTVEEARNSHLACCHLGKSFLWKSHTTLHDVLTMIYDSNADLSSTQYRFLVQSSPSELHEAVTLPSQIFSLAVWPLIDLLEMDEVMRWQFMAEKVRRCRENGVPFSCLTIALTCLVRLVHLQRPPLLPNPAQFLSLNERTVDFLGPVCILCNSLAEAAAEMMKEHRDATTTAALRDCWARLNNKGVMFLTALRSAYEVEFASAQLTQLFRSFLEQQAMKLEVRFSDLVSTLHNSVSVAAAACKQSYANLVIASGVNKLTVQKLHSTLHRQIMEQCSSNEVASIAEAWRTLLHEATEDVFARLETLSEEDVGRVACLIEKVKSSSFPQIIVRSLATAAALMPVECSCDVNAPETVQEEMTLLLGMMKQPITSQREACRSVSFRGTLGVAPLEGHICFGLAFVDALKHQLSGWMDEETETLFFVVMQRLRSFLNDPLTALPLRLEAVSEAARLTFPLQHPLPKLTVASSVAAEYLPEEICHSILANFSSNHAIAQLPALFLHVSTVLQATSNTAFVKAMEELLHAFRLSGLPHMSLLLVWNIVFALVRNTALKQSALQALDATFFAEYDSTVTCILNLQLLRPLHSIHIKRVLPALERLLAKPSTSASLVEHLQQHWCSRAFVWSRHFVNSLDKSFQCLDAPSVFAWIVEAVRNMEAPTAFNDERAGKLLLLLLPFHIQSFDSLLLVSVAHFVSSALEGDERVAWGFVWRAVGEECLQVLSSRDSRIQADRVPTDEREMLRQFFSGLETASIERHIDRIMREEARWVEDPDTPKLAAQVIHSTVENLLHPTSAQQTQEKLEVCTRQWLDTGIFAFGIPGLTTLLYECICNQKKINPTPSQQISVFSALCEVADLLLRRLRAKQDADFLACDGDTIQLIKSLADIRTQLMPFLFRATPFDLMLIQNFEEEVVRSLPAIIQTILSRGKGAQLRPTEWHHWRSVCDHFMLSSVRITDIAILSRAVVKYVQGLERRRHRDSPVMSAEAPLFERVISIWLFSLGKCMSLMRISYDESIADKRGGPVLGEALSALEVNPSLLVVSMNKVISSEKIGVSTVITPAIVRQLICTFRTVLDYVCNLGVAKNEIRTVFLADWYFALGCPDAQLTTITGQSVKAIILATRALGVDPSAEYAALHFASALRVYQLRAFNRLFSTKVTPDDVVQLASFLEASKLSGQHPETVKTTCAVLRKLAVAAVATCPQLLDSSMAIASWSTSNAREQNSLRFVEVFVQVESPLECVHKWAKILALLSFSHTILVHLMDLDIMAVSLRSIPHAELRDQLKEVLPKLRTLFIEKLHGISAFPATRVPDVCDSVLDEFSNMLDSFCASEDPFFVLLQYVEEWIASSARMFSEASWPFEAAITILLGGNRQFYRWMLLSMSIRLLIESELSFRQSFSVLFTIKAAPKLVILRPPNELASWHPSQEWEEVFVSAYKHLECNFSECEHGKDERNRPVFRLAVQHVLAALEDGSRSTRGLYGVECQKAVALAFAKGRLDVKSISFVTTSVLTGLVSCYPRLAGAWEAALPIIVRAAISRIKEVASAAVTEYDEYIRYDAPAVTTSPFFPAAEMQIAAFVWNSAVVHLQEMARKFVGYYCSTFPSERKVLTRDERSCVIELLALHHNVLSLATQYTPQELQLLIARRLPALQLKSLALVSQSGFSCAMHSTLAEFVPRLMTNSARCSWERWLNHFLHATVASLEE